MLADGTTFTGKGLGTPGTVVGELIFTTAMTGYGEALTDPSYRGQILLFAYPLIGTYGVQAGSAQYGKVQARAAIVATLSDSWDGRHSLREYLLAENVPTLHDVDTRAIAQWIRDRGATPAVLAIHEEGTTPAVETLEAMRTTCDYDIADFVSQTTVPTPETRGRGRKLVALLDCVNKRSVTEELVR